MNGTLLLNRIGRLAEATASDYGPERWLNGLQENNTDGNWINKLNTLDSTAVPNVTLNSTQMALPEGYLSGYTVHGVIIASILVTALMIVIVVGNALVIIAIGIDRNLKSEQNWFIASLAVSDLFVGLLIMPLSLANELMGYWFFGTILCELWLATDVLLCTASILNLCLISLDRYWSITRAVSYIKQRTPKKAMIMVTVVWLLSMIICFPPLVGWKRPQPVSEYGLPLCQLTDDLGYVVYSTLGSFYIPLIVMVVVYFKIYLAARTRARRNLKKRQATAQAKAKKEHDKHKVENGKNSGKITTSFSNLQDNGHKIDDELESSSREEPSEYPATTAISTIDGGESPGTDMPSDCTIPLQGMNCKAGDEKRRLLAEDTDSACDTPSKKKLMGQQNQHIASETDSMSDTSHVKCQQNAYKRGHGEDNMKPLLEDSHLESDSQREPDSAPMVNNNVTLCTSGTDIEAGAPTADSHKSASNSTKTHPAEKQKGLLLTPGGFRPAFGGLRHHKHSSQTKEKHKRPDDPEKAKRRIARAKERRATLVLGIIMATFILCWLPFFSTYLISSLTGAPVPELVFDIFFWAGYCNSGLNPVIYTIFNRDFRHAFQKILFGRRRFK